MAKPILAASNVARNDSVSKLTHTFKCVLQYLAEESNNCEIRNNYLQAIETLIDLGFKAVKEWNVISDIKNYQQYLQSYIYHSSIFLEKERLKFHIDLNATSFLIAQTLVNILLLAEHSFAKLGYPKYYQEFACAVEILLDAVDLTKIVRVVGLV